MIKGIRIGGIGKAMSYLDKLVVPIIENTPFEEDLTDSMAAVSRSSPFPRNNDSNFRMEGHEEVP